MNKETENFIDKTVLCTPKPCASSTIARKDFLRATDKKYRLLNFTNTSEEESLGIINFDDYSDILSNTSEDALSNLKKQKQLAQNALEKSKTIGLPSRFFVPSDRSSYTARKLSNSSTVNESDLLKSRESRITSSEFYPNDVSTPRNSEATDHTGEQSNKLFYNKISDISKEIRNSDVSLTDLCSELSRFSLAKSNAQPPDFDSGLFAPGELMEDQFLKDELSWRNKKDIPTKLRTSNISNLENYNRSVEKYSLGAYFKGGCDSIDNGFFKKSPDKKEPVPLVDLTNTITDMDSSRLSFIVNDNIQNDSVTSVNSIMSISQIAKIISSSQDTPRIINCLVNKKRDGRDRGSIQSNTFERDIDDFVASEKRNSNKAIKTTGGFRIPDIPKLLEIPKMPEMEYRQVRSSVPRVEVTSPTFVINSNINDDTRTSLNTMKLKKTPEASACTINTNTLVDRNSPLYLPIVSTMTSSPSENKENESDRSLTSIRSGSSLDSLPEGKFPIKSNRLELVWGTLKVGRTNTQQFQIRNQLNQRIKMQASISGSCFRIAKDCHDSEILTLITFVLRPFETKSLSVIFSPTKPGAAFGKINFHPILGGEIQHSKRQVLTLYGYGGHAICDITNVAKDSNGKLWLSFGRIDTQVYVQQKIFIKNGGNLCAFSLLEISSKGAFTFSDLKIEPREFIIRPQEEVEVMVRYSPTKVDFKYLNKMDIVEIGQVKIVMGAEATRGRIRRLCRKLQQQNVPIEPLVEKLSKPFSNERIPSDLMYLKESVSCMKDLLQHLSFREINLTIEQDLESTLVNPNFEESSVYHTLYQGNMSTMIETTVRKENSSLFNIEPTNIILTLPMKKEDTVLLHSVCSQEIYFEIRTEADSAFGTFPTAGVVAPGETVVIKVFCKNALANSNDLERILVCVGDEVVEITIKSVFVKSK